MRYHACRKRPGRNHNFLDRFGDTGADRGQDRYFLDQTWTLPVQDTKGTPSSICGFTRPALNPLPNSVEKVAILSAGPIAGSGSVKKVAILAAGRRHAPTGRSAPRMGHRDKPDPRPSVPSPRTPSRPQTQGVGSQRDPRMNGTYPPPPLDNHFYLHVLQSGQRCARGVSPKSHRSCSRTAPDGGA